MARNRKIAIGAVCAAAAVLVLCLVIGIWFFFSSTADDGLILNNVYAAGVNLGGMTPEEAKAALHVLTDGTYTDMDMVITTNEGTLSLSPANTGASLDVEKLVEDATMAAPAGAAPRPRPGQSLRCPATPLSCCPT